MIAVLLGCFGCGLAGPTAPDDGLVRPTASSKYSALSGLVYETATAAAGEPPVSDVLVEVTNAGGSIESTRTADDGSYRVLLEPGPVRVTVSKKGYEPRNSHVVVASDVVLNFSLSPI